MNKNLSLLRHLMAAYGKQHFDWGCSPDDYTAKIILVYVKQLLKSGRLTVKDALYFALIGHSQQFHYEEV